jgi:dienelactone hydrolase
LKRIRGKYIALLVLVLLLGPVLLRQLLPPENRHFDYVSLADTVHTEVDFRNEPQEINLAGLLFIPPGQGPFPAAVIIHGSGTSHRDSGWYLTLSHYLQQNGVVVLLPDKRGSEKSGGDWRTASFHDLATDTLAAIEFLVEQEQVSISEIGVVGMSQGGWIAPIVASESDRLAFVVTMVGSAVTPIEQLQYEENYNIRQMGFLPGVSNVLALVSAAIIRNGRQSEFWNSIGDYDPIPYWQKLSVDALIMYGREDTNVPSVESAARLREIGNPAIKVLIYDGSGHPLEDPVGQGNSIIREDALRDIHEFIREVAGMAASHKPPSTR